MVGFFFVDEATEGFETGRWSLLHSSFGGVSGGHILHFQRKRRFLEGSDERRFLFSCGGQQ